MKSCLAAVGAIVLFLVVLGVAIQVINNLGG